MTLLRRVRYVLWGLVGIVAFVTGAIAFGRWTVEGPYRGAVRASTSKSVFEIGGPFVMTDHRGRIVTDRDIRGRPTMMFFGFTSCPDVCPTTLASISAWLETLGADADRINAIFVSVDSERDTIEQMAAYLSSFDRRILGLTGTAAQLEQMARNYRFYYRRVPLDGGSYTMEHTATVYLLNTDGRFASTIDFHEDPKMAIPKLRRLLALAQ